MPEVKVYRDAYQIKVYINDFLHLQIPLDNHNGIQSYIEGTYTPYHIDFYRKSGETIKCEYENRNLWESILTLLDSKL